MNKLHEYFTLHDYWRFMTVRKYVNVVSAFIQERIIKNKRVFSYPHILTIEASGYCNLNCPLCPTGRGDKGRTKGIMAYKDFRKIIDEMSPYLLEVQFYDWGEPFINKEIFRMIRYANDRNIKTIVSSNLNAFKPSWAGKLVRSGLSQLTVSADSASEKSYAFYRKGGDFNTMMSNLKSIIEKKRKLSANHLHISYKFLVMKHNEHEVPEVMRICKELGIDPLIAPLHTTMGDEMFFDEEELLKKGEDWLPKDDKNSLFDYAEGKRKNLPKTCRFLYSQMSVNSNGDIFSCCMVYKDIFKFGNAFEEGVKKAWNNGFYRAARDAINKGKEDPRVPACIKCHKNGLPP